MPGKTPYEAYNAFVNPLSEALACVATAKATTGHDGKTALGKVHNLHLTGTNNDGFVRLKGEPRLELRSRFAYSIIEDPQPAGRYRCTTRRYAHALQTLDGREVIVYHWHPGGSSKVDHPHIHIGSFLLRPDAVLRRGHHIYSGRVTFESVVRFAIELGAEPFYDDWDQRLAASEGPHIKHRSW